MKEVSEFYVAEFGRGNNKIEVGAPATGRPPLLIGSVFYKGHKAEKFDKDKDAVEKELVSIKELSEATGIPYIIDVIGDDPEKLADRCELIYGLTARPFLLDGLNDDIRIRAAEILAEIGLIEYAVYNSIEPTTPISVLRRLSVLKPCGAVLLCFGGAAVTPRSKFVLLTGTEPPIDSECYGSSGADLRAQVRDPSSFGEGSLLYKAAVAGITDFIVDTAVLDTVSIGICAAAASIVSRTTGLPVGCAPANAFSGWKGRNKLCGKTGYISFTASVITHLIDSGCSFILYGSVNKADFVFPAAALGYVLYLSNNQPAGWRKNIRRLNFRRFL